VTSQLSVALVALSLALPGHAQSSPSEAIDARTARADKQCATLQRKIAKEEGSLSSFEQTIAADKKGRESCSTKPMCGRYDEAIKVMEARKVEHAGRLAKLKSDAAQACKSS
jgi:hypothetical protein